MPAPVIRRWPKRTYREKWALIDRMLDEHPDWANNRIGYMLGVAGSTVRVRRLKREGEGTLAPVERTIGRDGKDRPARRAA